MKKLAIVGAHEATRDNAPFDNPDYEIWGITRYAKADWMKRCDTVIEIHPEPFYTNHPEDKGYWEWLQNTDATVRMLHLHMDIKNAVMYPLQSIRDELLKNVYVHGERITNLGSSPDFAIALAIYQKYDVIDIYGVEMGIDTKYMTQRPGFAFWTGLAAGRGITLNVNCTDNLFTQPVYASGYVGAKDHVAFLRIDR